jgi:tRNA modification GTPase
MLHGHLDPIIAIATAAGRGAVGIVRISGGNIQALTHALCGRSIKPRHASYLPFADVNGQVIDQGLALYFPAPNSYTGEDVLELQAHGGPVVLQLLMARCLEAAAEIEPQTGQLRLPGLRVAQPGEFTQRAFLNDKIDLAQAEAIADLIDASTDTAARSAARSLSGEFSRQITALLGKLVHLRMLIEATLDFPEEDIDFIEQADAKGQLQDLQATLVSVLQGASQGAILREGIKVVIAGQPNAGKSSLLNALAGAELAIVTPIAGTTRDKVSQLIQIEGVPLHVVDTAGLRDSESSDVDAVEKIGIERAWTEIQSADAVLFLHDLTRMPDSVPAEEASLYAAGDEKISETLKRSLPATTPVINVWNKSDSAPEPVVQSASAHGVVISAKNGTGLPELRRLLLQTVGWQSPAEGVFMARERHVSALQEVKTQLEKAWQQVQSSRPALDLLAEDLRQAQLALGQIKGEFTTDDLLGEIFSKFCIGK